jgi:short-subunit dehydrogenase
VTGLRERYGPWALVAGASEGIGAAFAAELARRAVDVVLVARRPHPLEALARRLPVRTVAVPADLATDDGLATVAAATDGLETTMPRRAPGTLAPEQVARAALRALGRRPRTVPGGLARTSSALMSRLLPRRAAIGLMARASRDLSGPVGPGQEPRAPRTGP